MVVILQIGRRLINMEPKDAIITALAIILVGSITVNVIDTGEEITCRTGNGWELLEDNGNYYKAICPYKTKEPVEAYCSGFRATSTKERYGCDKVILVEAEPDEMIEEPRKLVNEERENSYTCFLEGCDA